MYDKYLIRNGENLDIIANKFNTNKDYLKSINNIMYEDMLRAGMELVVPKGKEQYFDYYKIEQGDTLFGIARKYNINPELLANMNGLDMDDYIYPDQEILIPKSGFSYYITKQGDTLSTVSQTFNTNLDALMRDNDAIYLMEGQLMVSKKS